MTRENIEAIKAWDDSFFKGEMDWLKDTAFISADFFQPPGSVQPNPWERIAVPPAASSHARGRIFKRVPGRTVDVKYNAVAAELESQGFDERKRVKLSSHRSVWGPPRFDPRYKTLRTDRYDMGKARYQVKQAYKQIAKDNWGLLKNARPSKRRPFNPSLLMCTPRKRHNTRWPVSTPTWEVMIGKWQPYIIFQLNESQIDDPAYWQQKNQKDEAQQKKQGEKPGEKPGEQHDQQTKKRFRHRRSIVQSPSLSTITETSGVPGLKPAMKHRSMYSAPANRWSAAAEKYYTTHKVASSPLKNFTVAATPTGVTTDDAEEDESSDDSSAIEITNERGHFRVPSSPISSRSATTTASNPKGKDQNEITNERGHFCCPSSPISSRSATTTASSRKRKAQNEISQRSPIRRRTSNAMAIFDQPTPEVHTEPEHETKRRVSLDNARRSDRQPEMTAFKKVRSWVASTFTAGRRRSHAETMEEDEEQEERPRTRRRHTLDVDVGRNPDIFGQTAGQQQEPAPENHHMSSTVPETVLPRAMSPTLTAREGAAELKSSASIASNVPIPQKENEATFAAQEDSISEAESESSTTTNEANTAMPLYQSKVVIDWNAITNIDDKIRDLLDRKAAIVYNEPLPITKEDDGDSTLSEEEEEETQPFEVSVLDRIMKALSSDEDEDMTTDIPEVNNLASELPVADPAAADILMADSPVTDLPALDSPARESPVPDLSIAMETTVEIAASDITKIDIPISEEATTMSQSFEVSKHDSSATIEPAVMSQSAEGPSHDASAATPVDAPIPEGNTTMSQSFEVSEHNSSATIEHSNDISAATSAMADAPISEEVTTMSQSFEVSEHNSSATIEPTAMSQSVEAPSHDTSAARSIEPTVMIDEPISEEPKARSQSHEAPNRDVHTAVPNELMPSASTSEKPMIKSQPAEAPGHDTEAATALMVDEPIPDEPTARSQSVEATEGSNAAAPALDEPAARSQVVEAPNVESNDEEYAMLHSFVRRAQMKPKRKESTTSSTGSPKAQVETSTDVKSPRQPLGHKDANRSPSPSKKRKLKEAEEAPLDMTKTSRLVKPDLDDTTPQPLRKRRRKGSETSSGDEIFNPEMAMSQSLTQRGASGGPRRSKRVATIKPAEPVTPSHIPVRLSGSFDADMPAVSTAGLMQKKSDRDLTSLTRTNTRRNKGAALPVPARLAGLSLPAESAFDADPFTSPSKPAGPRATGRGKAVRWDETLARFQGDSGAPGAAAAAEEPAASVPAPASAPAPAPAPASAPPPASPAPAQSEKKKALRPRPSRLPAAVAATKTAKTAPAPAQTPSRVTPAKSSSAALGARLGTPAPKRRGSARK